MHWKRPLLIVLICLSGCGFNADEPVYDTAANPEGFPPLAVSMLEQIESGQLQGFDAIAGGFGELYTENTELLDSEPWRAVIDRLGLKFGRTADSLRGEGIATYRRAAEYYQLASFARPQDKELYQRALTFETWRLGFDNSALDLTALVDGTEPQLAKYLAVCRYFALGDDARREFFVDNLRKPLRDRLKKANQLTPENLAALEPPDRCLASYLGLTKEPVNFHLASFQNPAVDLIACRVTQVDTASYIAEVYFVPQESVSGEFTVAVRMSQSDSLSTALDPGFNYSQLQLKPDEPSSEWKPGRILAAARQFDYPTPPASLQVSMIDRSEGKAKYLELAEGGGSFFRLDDSTLVRF